MRMTRVVEGWTLVPLERFIMESGARLTLLMTPAGQVLAQHGFTRAVDVMSAAALGAAIVSSTSEIAKMMEQADFRALNHRGVEHGIFLAGFETPRGRLLALVVYGNDSSMGLVELFFETLKAELVSACPVAEQRAPVLAADFERELNASLGSLFGR